MTRRAREDDNEEEFRGLREEHPFLPTRATSADLLASVFRFMPQPPQEFYDEVRNFDWRIRRFISEAHHYTALCGSGIEDRKQAYALMRRGIVILERVMNEMHFVREGARTPHDGVLQHQARPGELYEPWGMYPDEAIRVARKVKIALSYFTSAFQTLPRKELRDLSEQLVGHRASMTLAPFGGPESLPFALVGGLLGPPIESSSGRKLSRLCLRCARGVI